MRRYLVTGPGAMPDHYKSRASTHADGCWGWGPKHYECADLDKKAAEE